MRYEFIIAEKVTSTTQAAFPELRQSDSLPGQRGTVMFGPVIDSPNLHGLLDRFQDFGLTVVEMRMLPD